MRRMPCAERQPVSGNKLQVGNVRFYVYLISAISLSAPTLIGRVAMIDKASYINKRFPDQKNRVDHLMALVPEITNICEDLADCVNALQYWTKSKESEAETRVGEYRNLIQELKAEIVQALDAVNPS